MSVYSDLKLVYNDLKSNYKDLKFVDFMIKQPLNEPFIVKNDVFFKKYHFIVFKNTILA